WPPDHVIVALRAISFSRNATHQPQFLCRLPSPVCRLPTAVVCRLSSGSTACRLPPGSSVRTFSRLHSPKWFRAQLTSLEIVHASLPAPHRGGTLRPLGSYSTSLG